MSSLGDAFARSPSLQAPTSHLPLPRSTFATQLPPPTFPHLPSPPHLSSLNISTPHSLSHSTLSPPQNHSNPRQVSLIRPQRLQINSAALRATRGGSSVPIPLFARVDGGKASCSIVIFSASEARGCGAGVSAWGPDTEWVRWVSPHCSLLSFFSSFVLALADSHYRPTVHQLSLSNNYPATCRPSRPISGTEPRPICHVPRRYYLRRAWRLRDEELGGSEPIWSTHTFDQLIFHQLTR
jgi:hypothetical protein